MPAGSGGRHSGRVGGGAPAPAPASRPPAGGYSAGGGGFEFSGTGGKTTGSEKQDKAANFTSKFFDPGGILFDDDWGATSAEDAAAQLAAEMAFWGDVYGEERKNVDHNAQAKMANMMFGLDPYREGLGAVWGDKAPNLDFSGMFTNDFRRADVDAMRAARGPRQDSAPAGPTAPPGALRDGLRGGFAGRLRDRVGAGEREDSPSYVNTSGEGAPPPPPKRPRSVGRGGRGGSDSGAVRSALLRGR